MTIRLVATDLDGTLLCSNGVVDRRTRTALLAVEEAGIAVVLCTARPVRWTRPLAQQAGIDGPVVCTNGAVLWDLPSDALIDRVEIDPDVAREAVARLRPLTDHTGWGVESVDGFGHEPSYELRWPVPDDTVVDHIEALLTRSPVRLTVRGPGRDPDTLVEQARQIAGDLVEITHSSTQDTLLEITARGIDKGSGLARLCQARGLDASEVIAFGDMPNDLAMLRWAGRGVAVANAHPEVLAVADAVTGHHDHGGVAEALEALLADLD